MKRGGDIRQRSGVEDGGNAFLFFCGEDAGIRGPFFRAVRSVKFDRQRDQREDGRQRKKNNPDPGDRDPEVPDERGKREPADE